MLNFVRPKFAAMEPGTAFPLILIPLMALLMPDPAGACHTDNLEVRYRFGHWGLTKKMSNHAMCKLIFFGHRRSLPQGVPVPLR